ncbi:superfamily II DNA or RNA helicase [Arthrobacter sp. CAN_A212]|uniref:DEAD/DEAH box helicase n=1 Tax=unclassified Arthrobacter TaxID=235627 RepID=UPI001A2D8D60|nr:DEAD/DEAH box helicase [Arthrobacter sp. CAN_C5]MBP2218110.1 superfamily II DNA or RNA helicase [Arthrobacter sp. CAN_C5]
MPQTSSPMIDVTDIIRMVGGASFQRGQTYAKQGAVTQLAWDPSANTLDARVQGNSPGAYRTRLFLSAKGDGRYHLRDSFCSCPISLDCKHVAATALQSNTEHLLSRQELTAPVRKSAPQGWQSSLSGLINPPTDEVTGPVTARTPLALQFELRSVQGLHTGWQSTPKTQRRTAKPQLGVRPVIRNSKGNWVKNNLSWGSISYQTYGMLLDPDQHRWFSQFPSLHRGTGVSYFGNNDSWLYLEDFSNPLLWQLLREAQRLGVEFVASTKGVAVVLAGSATLKLDATTTDDQLRLCPILEIDGHQHAPETAQPISTHGIYTVHPGSPTQSTIITLAPSAKRLTDHDIGLLLQTAPVVIPAAERPLFLDSFYPRLRQAIEVISSDDSVTFPDIAPPLLVLTAHYTSGDRLELAWDWEYRLGEDTTRKALHPEPGAQDYRDPVVEEALLRTARVHLGATPLEALTLEDMGAVEFTEDTLPKLLELDGIRVDVVGEQPSYEELTEPAQLTITTVETDNRDWFDLGVLVTVQGRKIPFDHIFRALAQGKKKIKLVDNSYLSMNQPVFEQLRELIEEARALNEWEPGLKISRYQAGLWAEFEDLAEETEEAQGWRAAVAGLNDLQEISPTPVPPTLFATLRPYQQDGFNWLAFLYQHGLGGVLGDDMGLGKTLQALALLTHAKEQGESKPFLVVAPTSVVPNWVSEAHRFAPGLAVTGVADTQAKSGVDLATLTAGADVVVTSYTLFRLDFEGYQSQEWAGLILDEAQFVKNRTAKVHLCAKEFSAPFKLAITGTPMENNLMELWSLFSITAPGLFPSARRFTEDYRNPIEKSANTERLARLRRRIRPLLMRRTKEAVASDLPPKQEQVLEVELHSRHWKIYQTHLQRERQKLLGLIEDLDRNRMIVFRSLTLLRMLSLDASLVDQAYDGVPSAKLDVLFEQLEDVVAEGHRALVFSQFTSFLKKAAERLDAQGIAYSYLDGSTLRRGDVINRFKDGEAPVFLISLKAGGFGLNLTEADYVFLLDPWWNPATEAQAVDRTHRIGQTRNVMVYRMVASGTIEEKVMKLKEQKAKLFSSVMDDDAVFSSALTADDIRGLLEG